MQVRLSERAGKDAIANGPAPPPVCDRAHHDIDRHARVAEVGRKGRPLMKLERPRPKDPARILKHVLSLGGNPRGPPEVQSRFISHDKRFVAQDRPPPADSGETLQATSRLSYVEPTNIGRRPKQDARREERRRPQGPPALHQCAPRWLCGRDATSRRQHGGRRSRPRASAGCRAEPARSQRAQARTRPYRARANAGAWHSP